MNLTTLLANVRHYLGDTTSGSYTWTDDQLKLFINNAIAAYSIHFPRRFDTSLDATAGSRQYNLPYNVHGILSVEYQPGGTSSAPPTFYRRMDSMLDEFYTTAEVYDWFKDDTSSGTLAPSTIIVNPVSASDADTYLVVYNGDHAPLTLAADVLSVPDRHINLIYLHIRWQSIMELSTGIKKAKIITKGGITAGSEVQPYSEIDLKRNIEAYDAAVRHALKAESESVHLQWEMDKHKQVY